MVAPILATLRALFAASPLGFARFMTYVVFFAGLPLASIVVNGYLVAAVPDAVRDGMISQRLTALLLATFALYAAQQLNQLGLVFVAALGRRLHRFLPFGSCGGCWLTKA
ncbi:MAG: hypothetical protein ACRDZO_03675 [Egibacteraceae bacterium]